MEKRKQLLIDRTANFWGLGSDYTAELLRLKPNKSIRLNINRSMNHTLTELEALNIQLKPIEWASNCFWSDNSSKLVHHPVFENSDVVVQNASSFCPVINLDAETGDKILDLCAAPGLKTSHISDVCGNNAEIIANEYSSVRFKKMEQFFSGYKCNINCIKSDGRNLSNNPDYLGYFDRVLVDAPCSGEANINIDDNNSLKSWSIKNIKRLQSLQLGLLKTAYRLVKNKGVIIYSTCTINAEENEVVISKFINSNSCYLEKVSTGNLPTVMLNNDSLKRQIENDILKKCARIMPSQYNEAFFVAKIVKTKEDEFYFQK
jgi:16S rRNA C967 or C1407 C5-methylase (RsmB/RsmF family)